MTTIIFPPGSAAPTLPASSGYTNGSVDIDGVGLNTNYTFEPLTHVVVSSMGDGRKSSWLGYAMTSEPVPQADVKAAAKRLGRDLLASFNTEVLCIAAVEELRRRFFAAQAENDHGAASALSSILPLVCVLVDRIEPGMADKAHEPQRQRNLAEPPMTFAEGVAATVKAITDGLGDQAEVAVVVVPESVLAGVTGP